MREVTQKITLYSFDELSDKAKQVALANYRDNCMDYDWWEGDYEYFKDIGKVLGIDIENIYFRGFWSQGDGACFEGTYKFEKDAVKKVKEYAPKDNTLRSIAEEFEQIQNKYKNMVVATVKHRDIYYHEHSVDIEVLVDDLEIIDPNDDEVIKYNLRMFMRWMYYQLECTYDGLNSDEYIVANFEDNEYEFYESGRLYR